MTSKSYLRQRKKYANIDKIESQLLDKEPKKSRPTLICQWFGRVLCRIFAFPLVEEPICFHRADLDVVDEAEEAKALQNRRLVEDMVNFDSEATKITLHNILERRKEIMEGKDHYHVADVDLTKYPGWDEVSVKSLKAMFRIFDISQEGLVDFEEISTVLTEFGDKTPETIRKKQFYKQNVDEFEFESIGFDDFVEIIYNLTMKPVDPSEQSLAETLKKIEKNVSVINNLDVFSVGTPILSVY